MPARWGYMAILLVFIGFSWALRCRISRGVRERVVKEDPAEEE
jgi:hypothetical protein